MGFFLFVYDREGGRVGGAMGFRGLRLSSTVGELVLDDAVAEISQPCAPASSGL